ncbi:hypothetical protein C5C10_03220 [Rathayibacter sp. AY1A3]|nr:hypothetical protein C5C10_03220 [Rathayibacter sp. AY1A3]
MTGSEPPQGIEILRRRSGLGEVAEEDVEVVTRERPISDRERDRSAESIGIGEVVLRCLIRDAKAIGKDCDQVGFRFDSAEAECVISCISCPLPHLSCISNEGPDVSREACNSRGTLNGAESGERRVHVVCEVPCG